MTMDAEKTSEIGLCIDCAVHPSIKRFIKADSETGLCALCGRPDAVIQAADRSTSLTMLLRALIRFYWDEWAYNPHWGGDSPLALLSEPDNPVVLPPVTDSYLDDFHFFLEEPPYPDWDKGISIYAGHDQDGIRGVLSAISRAHSMVLSKLRRRLLVENFSDVEGDLEEQIEPFLEDITCILPSGELWHRARLGHKRTIRKATLEWEGRLFREPWTGSDLGAPPPPIATVGRLNRAGVSMLYLASNPETALAEIRPHPGHLISLGGFRSTGEVRIADFDPDIALFSDTDARLSLYEIIFDFDRSMSTPVTPDKQTPYLLTQLLSEVLRRRGIDGVRYKSSVSGGVNLCIFNPDRFTFEEGHSEVRRLESIRFEAASVPTSLAMEPGDLEI